MILFHGNTESLKKLDWYMLELRSERTIESILRRVGAQIPSIFHDSPIEVVIPVASRDLDTFELTTMNYVFVRSSNFSALLRLRTITGVVGLVTEGDSNNPSKVLKLNNDFVETQIKELERKFLARAEDIQVDSFVRIMDGSTRDWCGTVISIHDGSACVQVDIKTKLLFIETPVRNLINLEHVPEHLRVFYYSPLVDKLECSDLIAEDLRFEEDPAYMEAEPEPVVVTKLGRQQTVTALVKRLIQTGTTDPREITTKVVEAIRKDRLKVPKSLLIVHGIIKNRLIRDYFRKKNPAIRNYREVLREYGDSWRFPIQVLADAAKDLTCFEAHASEEKKGTDHES